MTNHAAQNPPVTAAGVSAVVMNLLAAFANLTDTKLAAVSSAVSLVAAVIAQRFTTPTGGKP